MPLISTIKDNFNDNSIDTGLLDADSDVTEQNQQLWLPRDTTGGAYTQVKSVDEDLDLEDNEVALELVEITDFSIVTTFIVYPLFVAQKGTNYSVGFRVYAGNFECFYATPSMHVLNSVTYSPADHRYLRLRYKTSDSKYYFDVSDDGLTWNTLVSSTSPPADPEKLTIYSRIYHTITAPDVILKIDNLNTVGIFISASGITQSTSSGTASVDYSLSISSQTVTSSNAVARVYSQTTQIDKTYLVKIYESDGTYIGIWKDRTDPNDFAMYSEINNGGSGVKFRLGRSARNMIETREAIQTEAGDDLQTEDSRTLEAVYTQFKTVGEGTDADLNYNVDVYVYEGSVVAIETEDGEIIETEDGRPLEATLGSPDGRIIFSGWISKYRAVYGRKEYVDVWALHHSTELDNHVVNDGVYTTVTLNSMDPSTMLTTILDQYISEGGKLSYSASSIDLTGTVSSYTFRLMTIHEAINKILELSPSNWYWYIDQGTNEVHFHQTPTEATHTFVYGRDIQEIAVERHIEDLVNNVYFAGGGDPQLLKHYSDATSQTNWRLGTRILTDGRVTTEASAEILSESLIDRYKDPVFASEVGILDVRYRTEDITLGQTVTFANFGNYIDDLVLLIVSIKYSRVGVVLGLGTLLPQTNKRLEEVKRNLRLQETNNVTDAPV